MRIKNIKNQLTSFSYLDVFKLLLLLWRDWRDEKDAHHVHLRSKIFPNPIPIMAPTRLFSYNRTNHAVCRTNSRCVNNVYSAFHAGKIIWIHDAPGRYAWYRNCESCAYWTYLISNGSSKTHDWTKKASGGQNTLWT